MPLSGEPAESATPPSSEKHRLYFLDFLRGIAILGVVLSHIGQPYLDFFPHIFRDFLENGPRGVQLFYILSGITIAGSWERTPRLTEFYSHRFFRIAPLFYLVLIFSILQDPSYRFFTLETFTHFSFINMFFPSWINSMVMGCWSIAIEMIFYAIAPFLLRWIRTPDRALIAFFSANYFGNILGMFAELYFKHRGFAGYNYDLYTYYWLPRQLPFFICGFFFYYAFIKKQPFHISNKGLSLAIFTGLFSLTAREFSTQHWGWGLFSLGPALYWAFPLLALVYLCCRLDLRLNLAARAVHSIGKVSFSIYLVHVFILNSLHGLRWQSSDAWASSFFIEVVGTLGLSYGLSLALYRWIETPFIQFGKRLFVRLDAV